MEIIKTRRDYTPTPVTMLKSGAEINAALRAMLAAIQANYSGYDLEIRQIVFAASAPSLYTRYGYVEAANSVRQIGLWYKDTGISGGGSAQVYVDIAFVTDAAEIFLPADSADMFANLGAVSSHTQAPYIDLASVPVRFARVGDASRMFSGLRFMTSIRVPSGTALRLSADSEDMFLNCTALVGGSGTAYDASHTDGTYARVDNPPDAPGYFTAV